MAGEFTGQQHHAPGVGRTRPKKRLSLHRLLAQGLGSRILSDLWRGGLPAASSAGADALRFACGWRTHARGGLRSGPHDPKLRASLRTRLCLGPFPGDARARPPDSHRAEKYPLADQQRLRSILHRSRFHGFRVQLPCAPASPQRDVCFRVRPRNAARAAPRRDDALPVQRGLCADDELARAAGLGHRGCILVGTLAASQSRGGCRLWLGPRSRGQKLARGERRCRAYCRVRPLIGRRSARAYGEEYSHGVVLRRKTGETGLSGMLTLGINYSQMHDSSACLVRDGELLFAVAEERISRMKHDAGFPKNAIRACVEFAKVKPEELDDVCFGWQPPGSLYAHDLKCYATGRQPLTYLNFLNSSRYFLSMRHQNGRAE